MGINYAFALTYVISILFLIGMLGLAVLLLYQLTLNQLEYVLASKSVKNERKMLVFRKMFAIYLVKNAKTYQMLSGIFLIFIIVNYPANCVAVYFFFKRKELVVRIAVGLAILEQVICIVFVHMVIANCNKRLSLVCKQMMSQFVPKSHRFKPRTKLKLSLFIQGAYTKNKYGIKYGNISLVSMMTVIKVTRKLVLKITFILIFFSLYTFTSRL